MSHFFILFREVVRSVVRSLKHNALFIALILQPAEFELKNAQSASLNFSQARCA